MMAKTTRIICICAISIAVTGKVKRVVVGDYLHHLQLFCPLGDWYMGEGNILSNVRKAADGQHPAIIN
jgi:hypothetical protein